MVIVLLPEPFSLPPFSSLAVPLTVTAVALVCIVVLPLVALQ